MTTAYINRIGTALPAYEAHATFMKWAGMRIGDRRELALLRRMALRAGIARRWTVLPTGGDDEDQIGFGGFYGGATAPSTSERMAVYAEEAPQLCMAAVDALGPVDGITHLVLASCTGFVAPGIDQIVARRLGLSPSVERTLVGFMGCYAAVAALRTAHHIVRSDQAARVLVLTVELCTLHLQPVAELEPILAMMLFGDGAAAALVTAEPVGLAIERPFAAALPESSGLITWMIGETGFAMHLDGAVPARIGEALAEPAFRRAIGPADAIDSWALHAGGRSIIDVVEQGLRLDGDALADSRTVLREYGNMSSATLMFVLARILGRQGAIGNGVALAFGPGLAAEGFHYRRAA